MQLAPEVFVVEPSLMVIGLNHRTAPLAMRERFWIGETKRYEVLRELKNAEGIEEVVVLSTYCRTEFLLWANEPTQAANSLLQFLGARHSLKLSEWQHFYRLLDEAALTHIFRVASGVDSMALCGPEIGSHVKSAQEQSETVGAAGRFLNAVVDRALQVAGRVRGETSLCNHEVSTARAAFEVARQIFGELQGRRLLLLGAGELSQASARYLVERGAGPVAVIDQSVSRAREVAELLGGTAATLGDRWKSIVEADIVISATGCPHVVLTREEAERIAQERNRVALVIIDLGMPRDVDPEVRRVDGILLYDLDGLEHAVASHANEPSGIPADAEKIVAAEAQAFYSQLQAASVVPTIVALRERLNDICRQGLESFMEERGPFRREQVQLLHAITAQVIQKIASSLVRELKDLPEKQEQEEMTAAVTRLFHLQSPEKALAGTSLEKQNNERNKQRAVAINY
jgi:glutamyl-tRNA reductase